MALNFGSFNDLGLDILSFRVLDCIKMLTVHLFFVEISQWWNRHGIFLM